MNNFAPQAGQIYLSRNGKTEGPFTPEQIDQMRSSGEIQQYSWIWDGNSPNWMPIAQAPAAEAPTRVLHPEEPARTSPARAHHRPAGHALRGHAARGVQVICHDKRNIMSGIVGELSENGFLLISDNHDASLPPFQRGGRVFLNLLNEEAGRSENAVATIVTFVRQNGVWAFQIQCDRLPALLSSPGAGTR